MNQELSYIDKWLEACDFSQIQSGIDHLLPENKLGIDELLSLIIQGKVPEAIKVLWVELSQSLSGEIYAMKQIFLYLLILGVISALFSGFSDLFAGQQIAQAGFYFLYLFLMLILTKVFLFASEIATETINNIVMFIQLFIPTYFVVVGSAQGPATAVFYYQVMLFVAYFAESFLVVILLPFIYSYVSLALLNGLWAEEKLTLLLDFMKKGIVLSLKISMGAVTGLSLVQAVIVPVLDQLKVSAIRKAVAVVPGLGGIAQGVTELVLGSAVLLKNSLGVLGMVLLFGICLIPVAKLLLTAATVKLGAALAGIVSDKRISSCTDRVGEGCFLLFRCVFTAISLFLIVIAVVAYSTSL